MIRHIKPAPRPRSLLMLARAFLLALPRSPVLLLRPCAARPFATAGRDPPDGRGGAALPAFPSVLSAASGSAPAAPAAGTGPAADYVFDFGKHRGTPARAAPTAYLQVTHDEDDGEGGDVDAE